MKARSEVKNDGTDDEREQRRTEKGRRVEVDAQHSQENDSHNRRDATHNVEKQKEAAKRVEWADYLHNASR